MGLEDPPVPVHFSYYKTLRKHPQVTRLCESMEPLPVRAVVAKATIARGDSDRTATRRGPNEPRLVFRNVAAPIDREPKQDFHASIIRIDRSVVRNGPTDPSGKGVALTDASGRQTRNEPVR